MEASHSWSSALVLKTRVLKGTVSSNLTASASWEKANSQRLPRPAVGGTRLGFERDFLAKRKRIYQSKYGSSRKFSKNLFWGLKFPAKRQNPLDYRELQIVLLVRATRRRFFLSP